MTPMKVEMRKSLLALALGVALVPTGALAASEMRHAEHGGGMDHAEHGGEMDHAEHGGEMDHAQHLEQAKAQGGGAPETLAIQPPDLELVTQDGEAVRFASEVLGERLVVMDFIYTSCTTVCPVLSAIMEKVAVPLEARYGDAVQLVSVSVDPGRDTPARLRRYADERQASIDWTFLTGEKQNLDTVLRAFGAYTPNFDDHAPMLVVGDPASGRWFRFYGFASPERLLGAVQTLHQQRLTAAAQPTHTGG